MQRYIPTFSVILNTVFLIILTVITCETKNVGLVHYPTTLAKREADVHCVDNAFRLSPAFTAWCDASGNWSNTTVECQCNEGYRVAIVENEKQICEGLLKVPCAHNLYHFL